MQTMTFSTSIRAGAGSVIGESGSYSADVLALVENQAAANAVLEEDVAVDVSQIKAMYIWSDQPVTVKTNSSSSPAQTFTLPAKKAIWWNTDRIEACPLTTDVTKLFFDNSANDDPANIKCGFLVDLNP